MDKKKVIELIKKGISYWNRSSYITSYEDDARECFNEAIKEISKSDWISVEERLPEFGENVVARTKGGYMNVSYRRKIPRDRISKEIMDDNGFILNFNLHSEKIAYWHKIDKLEE